MRLRKGSRVEVLSLNAPSYGAWRTAEILSGNGHTYSVRYYSFGLAKDETLEERVARKMIRPCPPITDVYRWESGELVEVLDHVFWKPATVLKELSGRCYAVRLLGVAVELTVHKVNIRARQAWEDERWVMIEKVSCSVKSSTLTGSDVNQNLKPHETSVVSIRLLKRPSPCESAESCTGTPKKMRSTEESNGYRQMMVLLLAKTQTLIQVMQNLQRDAVVVERRGGPVGLNYTRTGVHWGSCLLKARLTGIRKHH